MANKPSVWEFILAFRERWFTAMSGGASVPFVIAAALLDNTYAKVITALCAVTSAGFASFRVWKHERERVNTLEKKLEPKISVSLDSTCEGVRLVETQLVVAPPQRGPDSKWVQIMVEPLTEVPLVDCEARLKSVERLNADGSSTLIVKEPVYCPWSNAAPGQDMRTTIAAGIAQPANLLSAHENASGLAVEVRPAKVTLARELQKPGSYRFSIGVSARDAPTAHASFIFEWDGSYGSLKIRNE